MNKISFDKSSAGTCPPKCISDKRRTVLRITLAALAVLLLFSLAAAPASAGVPDWDDWAEKSGIAGDGDSEDTAYQIETPIHFLSFSLMVNSYGDTDDKFFKVTADIDLSSVCNVTSGKSWTPIGTWNLSEPSKQNPFKGTFDGQDHTISNLYILRKPVSDDDTSANHQGLFGYTEDATIKNLGLINVNITGRDNVGGLVGWSCGEGIIENCYVIGTVESNGTNVGGLVGINTGIIKNCYATVAVTGTGNNVGGLVGYNSRTIENCYATGAVEGSEKVGGLVGYNLMGTITNSVALNPSVSAPEESIVGRVAGLNDGSGAKTENNYAWEGMLVKGITVSGGTTSNKNGENKSSADLMTESTYTGLGWDFTNTWIMGGIVDNSGTKYPILKWQTKTVTFESNGGSDIDYKIVMSGTTVAEPDDPTRDGYIFGGWYTESALNNKYNFDTHVMADIVLFAKWTPAVTPTPSHTVTPAPNPSSGGSSTDSGSGHFDEYPRTVTNGGFVTFGTSPTVSSVDLPEGVSGSVILVVKSNTPAPDGKPTYTVFEINIPNYPEGEEAVIQFKITLEELEKAGYNPEDICLYHCDENGVWTALPTTFTIKDGVVYYESVTTAFSPFAIVFEENGATEVTQPEVTAVVQTPEPEQSYVEPTMPATTVPTPEQTKSPVGLVGLGLGLLGAAVVIRRK